MSEQGQTWSQSQKEAFPYIRRAISEGLTMSGSRAEYRAGGGQIGNELYAKLFKATFEQEGWKDTVFDIPLTYMVTDKMHQETFWDFREEYIMQMKVSGYSSELGMRLTRWITVESDKILTKQEWLWNAQLAISETLGSPPIQIDRVYEYAPLHRVR